MVDTPGPFAASDLNAVSTTLNSINEAAGKASKALIDGFAKAVVSGKSFDQTLDRKSTRLNSSHIPLSRMPSSA